MKELDKALFWDTKISQLDYKKNADFIIERVLSFGDKEDFQMIKKMYGLKKIKKTAIKIDYPNKKSLIFWSLILDIPINSFLCIKKLSTLKPNIFWKR